jgi:hypothetical protein
MTVVRLSYDGDGLALQYFIDLVKPEMYLQSTNFKMDLFSSTSSLLQRGTYLLMLCILKIVVGIHAPTQDRLPTFEIIHISETSGRYSKDPLTMHCEPLLHLHIILLKVWCSILYLS